MLHNPNMLFVPNLYRSSEELNFFNINVPFEDIKSFSDYRMYFKGKLEQSIRLSLQNHIVESLYDTEVAAIIAKGHYDLNADGFFEVFNSFDHELRDCLENQWSISSLEVSQMETTNVGVLASQLMSHTYLHRYLSEFYERFDILWSGEDIRKYYIELGVIDEEDSLEENVLQAKPDYDEVYDIDFFEISARVQEVS